MPRIRCHYIDCSFIDDGYCSTIAVVFDPDIGCVTYSPSNIGSDEDDWNGEDEIEEWDNTEDDDNELNPWLEDN